MDDDVLVFFYHAFDGQSVAMFNEEHMLAHPETQLPLKINNGDEVSYIDFSKNKRYKFNKEGARWLWDALQEKGFEIVN
jgi:hypothetical protein